MPACTGCQAENPARANFCLECGAPLAARCAGCGTELPSAAKVGAAPAPVPVAPDRRTSPLAEKIRQAKPSIEGERKQVTVLFADVKGSMEMAEQLDPEEWSSIMQRFFTILADGVARFEGFVDKFTGDGIMALFGAPIAHEGHAQRACYAALHLCDRLRQYADELRIDPGVNFSFRLGLNSGEVIVGRIGDDLRIVFTAQGHTVGLAQRMEALAESGHICVSEHTARLVEGYFTLQDLGRTHVKGAAAPVGLFDLDGVGSFRTRLDRAFAGALHLQARADPGVCGVVSRVPRPSRPGAGGERRSDGTGEASGTSAQSGARALFCCNRPFPARRANPGRRSQRGGAVP